MAVKGLDLFRSHFADFLQCYVLIGGAACDLVMRIAGLGFRATKDLDLVLCLEALDAQFARAFWAFVREGEYAIREASTGKKRFYRFQKPSKPKYPAMLELFSRRPDALTIDGDSHLTPIPINEAVSSLSAILLDEGYYYWIRAGRRTLDGVSIVGAERLVPMKARAWLDLTERRDQGDQIDSKAIKKHKNDVFRLSVILDADEADALPHNVAADLTAFLDAARREPPDLKALGMKTIALDAILERLTRVYRLEHSENGGH